MGLLFEASQLLNCQTLKRKLMTFPVLRIFDPALPVVLYTDSSDVHVGGALCQRLPSGELVVAAKEGPTVTHHLQ
eukprot:COSAG05_NODE_1011_length_6206_cov_2.116751_1_plen_75_part_00